MSKEYCLITGTAGFLGFYYTKVLLENGFNVIIQSYFKIYTN